MADDVAQSPTQRLRNTRGLPDRHRSVSRGGRSGAKPTKPADDILKSLPTDCDFGVAGHAVGSGRKATSESNATEARGHRLGPRPSTLNRPSTGTRPQSSVINPHSVSSINSDIRTFAVASVPPLPPRSLSTASVPTHSNSSPRREPTAPHSVGESYIVADEAVVEDGITASEIDPRKVRSGEAPDGGSGVIGSHPGPYAQGLDSGGDGSQTDEEDAALAGGSQAPRQRSGRTLGGSSTQYVESVHATGEEIGFASGQRGGGSRGALGDADVGQDIGYSEELAASPWEFAAIDAAAVDSRAAAPYNNGTRRPLRNASGISNSADSNAQLAISQSLAEVSTRSTFAQAAPTSRSSDGNDDNGRGAPGGSFRELCAPTPVTNTGVTPRPIATFTTFVPSPEDERVVVRHTASAARWRGSDVSLRPVASTAAVSAAVTSPSSPRDRVAGSARPATSSPGVGALQRGARLRPASAGAAVAAAAGAALAPRTPTESLRPPPRTAANRVLPKSVVDARNARTAAREGSASAWDGEAAEVSPPIPRPPDLTAASSAPTAALSPAGPRPDALRRPPRAGGPAARPLSAAVGGTASVSDAKSLHTTPPRSVAALFSTPPRYDAAAPAVPTSADGQASTATAGEARTPGSAPRGVRRPFSAPSLSRTLAPNTVPADHAAAAGPASPSVRGVSAGIASTPPVGAARPSIPEVDGAPRGRRWGSSAARHPAGPAGVTQAPAAGAAVLNSAAAPVTGWPLKPLVAAAVGGAATGPPVVDGIPVTWVAVPVPLAPVSPSLQGITAVRAAGASRPRRTDGSMATAEGLKDGLLLRNSSPGPSRGRVGISANTPRGNNILQSPSTTPSSPSLVPVNAAAPTAGSSAVSNDRQSPRPPSPTETELSLLLRQARSVAQRLARGKAAAVRRHQAVVNDIIRITNGRGVADSGSNLSSVVAASSTTSVVPPGGVESYEAKRARGSSAQTMSGGARNRKVAAAVMEDCTQAAASTAAAPRIADDVIASDRAAAAGVAGSTGLLPSPGVPKSPAAVSTEILPAGGTRDASKSASSLRSGSQRSLGRSGAGGRGRGITARRSGPVDMSISRTRRDTRKPASPDAAASSPVKGADGEALYGNDMTEAVGDPPDEPIDTGDVNNNAPTGYDNDASPHDDRVEDGTHGSWAGGIGIEGEPEDEQNEDEDGAASVTADTLDDTSLHQTPSAMSPRKPHVRLTSVNQVLDDVFSSAGTHAVPREGDTDVKRSVGNEKPHATHADPPLSSPLRPAGALSPSHAASHPAHHLLSGPPESPTGLRDIVATSYPPGSLPFFALTASRAFDAALAAVESQDEALASIRVACEPGGPVVAAIVSSGMSTADAERVRRLLHNVTLQACELRDIQERLLSFAMLNQNDINAVALSHLPADAAAVLGAGEFIRAVMRVRGQPIWRALDEQKDKDKDGVDDQLERPGDLIPLPLSGALSMDDTCPPVALSPIGGGHGPAMAAGGCDDWAFGGAAGMGTCTADTDTLRHTAGTAASPTCDGIVGGLVTRLHAHAPSHLVNDLAGSLSRKYASAVYIKAREIHRAVAGSKQLLTRMQQVLDRSPELTAVLDRANANNELIISLIEEITSVQVAIECEGAPLDAAPAQRLLSVANETVATIARCRRHLERLRVAEQRHPNGTSAVDAITAAAAATPTLSELLSLAGVTVDNSLLDREKKLASEV